MQTFPIFNWNSWARAFAVATPPKESKPIEAPPSEEKQPPPRRFAWKNYLLGFFIGLVGAFIFLYGSADRLEYGLHNFNYEIRGLIDEIKGSRPVHPDIAIVAIDDKSLKEIPEIYPWPRSYFAQLVDRLHESKAKVIVFDVVFGNPDRQDQKNDRLFASVRKALAAKGLFIVGFNEVLDRLNIKNDQLFAAAIKRAGNVVLGRTLSFEEHRGMVGSMQLASLQEPIATLALVAHLGRVDTDYDEDGQMRRGSLLRDYSGEQHRTLEAMALFLYNPPMFSRILQQYPGEFFFDYAGPPHTFPTYSFYEVISGLIKPEKFAGKVVFVGATAAILHDNFPAPFLMLGTPELLPGVEMHANQLNTILTNRFLTRVNPLALLTVDRYGWALSLLAGLIVMCLALQALLLNIRPGTGAWVSAGAILGFYLVTLYAFLAHLVWVDQVVPMISMALVYVATLFTHYRSEERKKKQVQAVFGQFVSPDVVEHIVTSGQMPTLGGEECEATLMFSDLAGFTSISENLTPPELVDIINEYLETMTNEILDESGTVDKYEGDAIMVFWGAPIPQADHARRACRAALKMHERFADLVNQWHGRGLQYEFGMRIGINTGPVVVGYMGHKQKMNYTAMGDTVNLAARLEPVNKQYGTKITISEFTHAQVKDDFVVRELDSIRVKGKIKPVVIYELIALRGQLQDPSMVRFFDIFAQGLHIYKQRSWEKAIQSFEQALLINPRDHASLMYISRCQEFMVSPPPADWDGVFVMTTK